MQLIRFSSGLTPVFILIVIIIIIIIRMFTFRKELNRSSKYISALWKNFRNFENEKNMEGLGDEERIILAWILK